MGWGDRIVSYLLQSPYIVKRRGGIGTGNMNLNVSWLAHCVNPFGNIDESNVQDYLDRCANIGAMYADVMHNKKLKRYHVHEFELEQVLIISDFVGNFIISRDNPLSVDCDFVEHISYPMYGRNKLDLYYHLWGSTTIDNITERHRDRIKRYVTYTDMYENGFNPIWRKRWETNENIARWLNFYDVVYCCDEIPYNYRAEYDWWLMPLVHDKGFYVYSLSDPRNGNIFYIGYTSQIYQRYQTYMSKAHTKRLDTIIKEIVYECGCGPKMEIIYTAQTKEEALEKEMELINYYCDYYALENQIMS